MKRDALLLYFQIRKTVFCITSEKWFSPVKYQLLQQQIISAFIDHTLLEVEEELQFQLTTLCTHVPSLCLWVNASWHVLMFLFRICCFMFPGFMPLWGKHNHSSEWLTFYISPKFFVGFFCKKCKQFFKFPSKSG